MFLRVQWVLIKNQLEPKSLHFKYFDCESIFHLKFLVDFSFLSLAKKSWANT